MSTSYPSRCNLSHLNYFTRYEFKSEKKAALRELGPRFTLRLKWIQKGTFDTIEGEYEWIIAGKRHEMETSRRRFFL